MSEKLDDVFRALHNAVLEAQKLTEQQHQRQIRRYFKISNTEKDKAPQYGAEEEGQPKTQKFRVPQLSPDSDEQWREIEVPELALSPPTSIKIRELKIDFKVNLSGLGQDETGVDPVDGKEETHRGPMEMHFAPEEDSPSTASISIVFDQAETPETYHRITDLLSKSLPLY